MVGCLRLLFCSWGSLVGVGEEEVCCSRIVTICSDSFSIDVVAVVSSGVGGGGEEVERGGTSVVGGCVSSSTLVVIGVISDDEDEARLEITFSVSWTSTWLFSLLSFVSVGVVEMEMEMVVLLNARAIANRETAAKRIMRIRLDSMCMFKNFKMVLIWI